METISFSISFSFVETILFDDQEILLFLICYTYFNQVSHIYGMHSFSDRFLAVTLLTKIIFFMVILSEKDGNSFTFCSMVTKKSLARCSVVLIMSYIIEPNFAYLLFTYSMSDRSLYVQYKHVYKLHMGELGQQ